MSDKTGIEWTDATWNPVRGCSRVSEGCRNCYAETIAARFSDRGAPYHGFAERGRPGSKWTGRVEIVEHMLDQPLRWKKPRRIFVNSMSDLFHESLPDRAIDQVFAIMALAPQHTFQVLSKRPERMRRYVSEAYDRPGLYDQMNRLHPDYDGDGALITIREWPLPNVWLGVSVENQAAADERIPHLLATPAAVRFLSCEPLLGSVHLRCIPWTSDRGFVDALTGKTQHAETRARYPDRFPDTGKIDWIIAGGESGPHARVMELDWGRSLRNQCHAARVPFFFKQWGEWQPGDGDTPYGQQYYKVGKKAAGSLLDGIQHKEFPK